MINDRKANEHPELKHINFSIPSSRSHDVHLNNHLKQSGTGRETFHRSRSLVSYHGNGEVLLGLWKRLSAAASWIEMQTCSTIDQKVSGGNGTDGRGEKGAHAASYRGIGIKNKQDANLVLNTRDVTQGRMRERGVSFCTRVDCRARGAAHKGKRWKRRYRMKLDESGWGARKGGFMTIFCALAQFGSWCKDIRRGVRGWFQFNVCSWNPIIDSKAL